MEKHIVCAVILGRKGSSWGGADHIYIYIYIYEYMTIRICEYMIICIYECVYIYIYVYVHMYVCMYVGR